jgi:hypothetical protein
VSGLAFTNIANTVQGEFFLESVTLENERTKIPSKQGKLINQ